MNDEKEQKDSPTKEGDTTIKLLKHDQFFRKAMEYPQVALEFFEAHLPPEIKALADLSTLHLERSTYVEESLRESISDVVFTVKFTPQEQVQDGFFFVLLEHQSRPDHFMVFRLLKYMIQICDQYLTQHPRARRLPLVYPLVFYNGTRKYQAARTLWKLFSHPELVKNIWNNDHQLINAYDLSDEALKQRAWSGILEFCLKHIHDKELLKTLEVISSNVEEIVKSEELGYQYLRVALSYVLLKVERTDKIELEHMWTGKLDKEVGARIMKSVVEQWFDEGKAEGEARGKAAAMESVAREMLAEGYDISSIIKLTKLDESSILALSGSNKTQQKGTHPPKHL